MHFLSLFTYLKAGRLASLLLYLMVCFTSYRQKTQLLLVECFGFVFNNLSPQKRINEWGYGLSSYIQHYSSII